MAGSKITSKDKIDDAKTSQRVIEEKKADLD